MLKDFKKFKKQLKDIKEKISNIRITNNVKLILVLIFFVVSIIFIANNRLRYDNKLEEKVANKIKIIELLNKVEDNYSLDDEYNSKINGALNPNKVYPKITFTEFRKLYNKL